MEYVIPVIVVAAFIAVYLISRPKIRAEYFDVYDDCAFKDEIENYVKSFPLPKEGGKTKAKEYQNLIKRVMRRIKRKRYCGFFDKFTALNDEIKSLSKKDFSNLDELPSIDGEARAIKLARFCLARSGYKLDDDRIKTTLDAQNDKKTLSFGEIISLNSAFSYAIIEKLAYEFLQIETLAKVYDLAAKYVYNPLLLNDKYKKLAKSKLFLSICALKAGYKMEYFSNIHGEVVSGIFDIVRSLIDTLYQIEKHDFSRYYTPLEILDKYENFSSASSATKTAFLNLVKEASDKENLDEFLYVVRLDKYMKSASAGHFKVRRLNLPFRAVCIVSHKRDITMLAAALSSLQFMNLYFMPNKKRKFGNKSISKIVDFENTFEPIYKFRTINFGISTSGGKLRISPALPKQIQRADVVFEANGVTHVLHIRRGDEKSTYIGDTLITGVEQIKLGDIPLDVSVILPKD